MASEATQMERDAMGNLSDFARKSMRSKPILRVLGKLQDKGWIEFDPFAGEAKITDAGRKALERQ